MAEVLADPQVQHLAMTETVAAADSRPLAPLASGGDSGSMGDMSGRSAKLARCVLGATGAALLARFAVGRRDVTDPDDSRVSVVTVFDTVTSVSRAQPLQGGRCLTVCGVSRLDLSDAAIADGAVVRLVTVLGRSKVLVAPGVRLVVLGDVHVGGHDVEAAVVEDPDPTVPTLFVEATTWFGGLEIGNGALSRGAAAGRR